MTTIFAHDPGTNRAAARTTEPVRERRPGCVRFRSIASCNSRSGSHFTLIELLVVIGIIALLAAALLASLSHAMKKGRRTDCISILHNISLAQHFYAEEYEDWLPPISGTGPDGTTWMFTDYFQPYMGDGFQWLCPSGDLEPSILDTPNGTLLHYGMNNYDGDFDRNGGDYLPGLSYQRLHYMADPDNVIGFADADPNQSPHNIGGAQSGTLEWPLTSLCEQRHSNGYVAAYLVGVVKWLPNEPNHEEWSIKHR